MSRPEISRLTLSGERQPDYSENPKNKMVGSSNHVDERRLRPVYDALDNLNNKQAIKLADAILKKQKECACAKALKALALVRSKRSHEAFPLLENIKETTTKLDDSTLQAMTMCYKESFSVEGIVSIYELAVKQSKDNEEFLSHLFMAYVRVGNYAKQQQAAMNLYKAFPKNPYYFWAVMSNVMQGITCNEGTKKKMFFSLAEKMVAKLISQGKVEAQEENDLYGMILQLQGKYEDLLAHINSEDKLKKTELEIECLYKLERWTDLSLLYKKLLCESPDQWSYIMGIIDTCIKLEGYVADIPIDTANEQPIYKVVDLKELFKKMHKDNPQLRGPLLGLLEISKQKLEEDGDAFKSTLIQYFELFGGKPCCYGDLRPYAEVLEPNNRTEFLEILRSSIKPCSEDSDHKQKVKTLMREICVECLTKQLGGLSSLSREERFATAKRYVAKYHDTLKLGENLRRTEPQYGDVLILLAVFILLDLNNEKGDDSLIWHIVLILEEVVERSPCFAQFKLLLVFLYYKLESLTRESTPNSTSKSLREASTFITNKVFNLPSSSGASGPCEKLLEEIDIKYMMYDSLGYLICSGVYTSGQFQLTQRIFDASSAFHKSGDKDIPEQLISAYKYGSFRQVADFTKLRNRINKSAHRHVILLDQICMDVVKYCNSTIETKKRFEGEMKDNLQGIDITEEFIDNRDLHVFDRFDSTIFIDTTTNSFEEQILYIRYRYTCLKLVSECIGVNFDDGKQNADQIENLMLDLKNIITEFQKYDSPSQWLSVHEQQPCELQFIVHQNHHILIQTFVQIYLTLFESNEINDAILNTISTYTSTIHKTMQDNSDEIKKKMVGKGEEEIFDGTSLRPYVYFLEISSFSAILLDGLKKAFKKRFSSTRKTRKKKGDVLTKEDSLIAYLEKCSRDFCEILQDLLVYVDDIKSKYVDKRLDDKALLDIFEKTNSTTVTKIWDKVQTSYQQSISEINQLLQMKIKFFQTLSR